MQITVDRPITSKNSYNTGADPENSEKGGRAPHLPPPRMKTSIFRTCSIQHCGHIRDAK